MRCGLAGRREQLSGHAGSLVHRRIHSLPFCGPDEQRAPVFAAEHAGKAASVCGDGVEDLATLSHAHAALTRNGGDPDRAFCVRADTVGGVLEIRPHTQAGERRIAGYVEGDELLGVGVGDHERVSVVDQGHAIGPLQAGGHLVRGAVRLDADDCSRAAVHVRVAGGVDDQLVERGGTEAAEIGLATQAFGDEEVMCAIDKTVQELAQLSPTALAVTKKAIYAWDAVHFDKGLARAETIYLQELMKTADAHEGVRAFVEKREPRWSAR